MENNSKVTTSSVAFSGLLKKGIEPRVLWQIDALEVSLHSLIEGIMEISRSKMAQEIPDIHEIDLKIFLGDGEDRRTVTRALSVAELQSQNKIQDIATRTYQLAQATGIFITGAALYECPQPFHHSNPNGLSKEPSPYLVAQKKRREAKIQARAYFDRNYFCSPNSDQYILHDLLQFCIKLDLDPNYQGIRKLPELLEVMKKTAIIGANEKTVQGLDYLIAARDAFRKKQYHDLVRHLISLAFKQE